MKDFIILGAGLSGTIANKMLNADVYEASAYNRVEGHKALLRFRDEQVSHATGVPFKKVTVTKAIWDGKQYIEPNIQVQNQYSLKVTGEVLPRSIIDLAPVTRYIAPPDFHDRLLTGSDIQFNYKLHHIDEDEDLVFDIPGDGHFATILRDGRPIISTIPLPLMVKLCYDIDISDRLEWQNIQVHRWQLKGVEAYQTVYFPSPETGVYRASITGSTLIVESMPGYRNPSLVEIMEIMFGVRYDQIDVHPLGHVSKRYGKIKENEDLTKHWVYRLTHDYGIFSLGRFAVWRNILLDDVYWDTLRIRQMNDIINDQYQILRGTTDGK